MAVTKKQIAGEIAKRTGLSQVDSVIIIEGLLAAVSRALIEGHNIEIRGFGRFKLKERKAHLARNPRSGGTVEIKAGIKPVFQASRELKARVNEPPLTPRKGAKEWQQGGAGNLFTDE